MFRNDINFLRAISVLGVLFYHLNFEILKGGFVGVDIFFVVSGFLMTLIINRQLKGASFSYYKFFLRRCQRIVPPLCAVVIFFLILNWFFAYSVYYKEQASHALSSLTFVSNIVYWQESGYFESDSKGKLFLHTWSLSVEWQFYLLYPILILLLKKICNEKIERLILIALTLFSFTLCVWASDKYSSANFFLLPTRAWEMLIGGLVYYYPCYLSQKTKKGLTIVGIIIIASSMLMFDGKMLWPNWYSAIPVLAAAVIIWSNVNFDIFSWKLFYFTGLISYSLYLWHWPLIAMDFNGFLKIDSLAILSFSLFMALLSYFWLERKK